MTWEKPSYYERREHEARMAFAETERPDYATRPLPLWVLAVCGWAIGVSATLTGMALAYGMVRWLAGE